MVGLQIIGRVVLIATIPSTQWSQRDAFGSIWINMGQRGVYTDQLSCTENPLSFDLDTAASLITI